MERKTLFRGKRLDNGEWACGSLVSFENGEKAILPSTAIVFKQRGTTTICCNECYGVDPTTVGQYTGLTDKNGVRIFVGDILCDDDPEDPSGEYLPVFGRVCFGEYHNTFNGGDGAHIGFFVEWEGNEDDDYSKTFRKDLGHWVKYPHCDVRGNIHDNPELLGGNE